MCHGGYYEARCFDSASAARDACRAKQSMRDDAEIDSARCFNDDANKRAEAQPRESAVRDGARRVRARSVRG